MIRKDKDKGTEAPQSFLLYMTLGDTDLKSKH